MKQVLWGGIILSLLFILNCAKPSLPSSSVRFEDDLNFLTANKIEIIVLANETGERQVIVSPQLQGRVMTSTATGLKGPSFGWINRDLISSGINNPHINAFGGEDRFWLGPEGGQFSIFFKKGDPFDLDHWFTPPPVNEEPFEVIEKSSAQVSFRKQMKLINYSGTSFDLEVKRTVRLLHDAEVADLGIKVPAPAAVKMVAFCSQNSIRNTGREAWTKETGLLSIWILGMFNPSPETTVVIPFKPGPESELGPVVNDAYFGKVPPHRLAIREDGVIFFLGDGQYRSKIGISPMRAKPFAGSWDKANGVLTIVHLTLPEEPANYDYVNSMWEIQEHPYAGDVVNSYNDGPPAPGAKPLGPFYELESSSPAAALAPDEVMRHMHTTIHFLGKRIFLDSIAKNILGVSLKEIEKAFK